MRHAFLFFCLSIFLASFISAAWATGEGELTGLGLGAVTGGVIGNQFGHGTGRVATTAAGVVGGAIIGDQLGKRFDQPDNNANNMGTITYGPPIAPYNYESFGTPNYVAPDAPDMSGNAGAIYSTGTCRPTSQPHNRDQKNYITECQQSDGTWSLMP